MTELDDETVDAYLRRIGATRPRVPDAAGLRDLQAKHLASVPYENIDTHLGRPLPLGDAAVDKVVREQRGGGCRELNASAFDALLRALGYHTELLGGRVFYGDRLGTIFGHVLLCVSTPEPWLVDVGFGGSSRYPLRMDVRDPQPDPHGVFQVVDRPHGDLDVLRDGKPVYRIETRPRSLTELAPILRWAESAPDSPIHDRLYCSIVVPDGRITLSGDVLIRTRNGKRTKEFLHDEAEIRAAYLKYFGITLDRLPVIPRKTTVSDQVALIGGTHDHD
ncbi:arylamine N-acetyltransferase family protein [Amycolatopsis pithecellobii]|uniref:Arylamine N-acetyltransferase n=1 Tax=Amycolatopsis pithecellobii TaxID=664692 RepID=A0A6N7Z1D7_9PSEU|nr:arylamine N-acetyltransferase [Amycolatopsis pithecellobii]MTD53344.1 arylamine N-acetyltransferase [Amycolatopsis pithecellobii]